MSKSQSSKSDLEPGGIQHHEWDRFFNGTFVDGEHTYAKLAFKTGTNRSDEQQYEFGSFYVGDNAMSAIAELDSSHDDQDSEAAISVKFAVLDVGSTLRNGHVWLHGLLCRIQSV